MIKPNNNKLASIYENVQFVKAFEQAFDDMSDQALQNITSAFKLVRNLAKALHVLQLAIVGQNGYA